MRALIASVILVAALNTAANSSAAESSSGPERGLHYSYVDAWIKHQLPALVSLEERATAIRRFEANRISYDQIAPFSIRDAILRPREEYINYKLRSQLYVADKMSSQKLNITDADTVIFSDGMMIFPSCLEPGSLEVVGQEILARKLGQKNRDHSNINNMFRLFTGHPDSEANPWRQKSLQRYLSDHDIAFGNIYYANQNRPRNASLVVLQIVVDKEQGTATISGLLSSRTPYAIYLLKKHFPQVHTLVLDHIPGTQNIYEVMNAGILIRDAGLRTAVLPGSQVASAGAILYWAGFPRTFAQGVEFKDHGMVGVNPLTGELRDLNKEFQPYLDDYLSLLQVHPLVREKSLGRDYNGWVNFTEQEMAEINAE